MDLGTQSYYTSHDCEGNLDHQGSVSPNQKGDGNINAAGKECKAFNQRKQPNLSIDIPSRSLEASSVSSVHINLPLAPSSGSRKPNDRYMYGPRSADTPKSINVYTSPGPSSSRGKVNIKKILPKLSFKSRRPSENEKDEASSAGRLEKDEASSAGRLEKPSILRSLSFTKIFAPTFRRTSSLPVATIADDTSHAISTEENSPSPREKVRGQINRSLSVPLNIKSKSIMRMDSLGSMFRVIPSTPRVMDVSGAIINEDIAIDVEGEDIPEEEAVCRICMIELCEGSDTMKLECSCKGDLALAHQECALKWFSIKGNRNCDVCKQEVQNLCVTLFRIQTVQTANIHTGRTSNETVVLHQLRSWQDMPIVVIISMLSYFCFLEQLMVADSGYTALVISLPFSCILGLLASLTSTTMVTKGFVWIYASVQFLLVVFFAHLFYSFLHMRAVMSIILATFAGFGVAMSGSSILVEVLRCIRGWRTLPPPITARFLLPSIHEANT